MVSPTLRPLFAELYHQALHTHQRRLLVLIGAVDWSLACLNQLPQALIAQPGLWVSTQPELPALDLSASATLIKPARCHQVLGREFGWVVIDAHEGLDPDALGASSGTLCGGGLLVLLLPAQPMVEQKPFSTWLERQLQPRDGILVVRQDTVAADVSFPEGRGQALPAPQTPSPVPASSSSCSDGACVTEDQAEAVRQIMRVAQGHRHRPLVISADRGRGKSAALGIAAARLILQRPRYIRVTAPAAVAVEPLFERLQTLLPGSSRQGGQVVFEQSRVEFIALDLLLRQLDTDASRCDLLLVDEAAAIPAPMLERLLGHHARIVFSTTVHGYEGTGRGFLIRFRQALELQTPNWRRFELTTPIRWRAGDPLERWVFDTLLLDAEPDPRPLETIDLAHVCWRHWSPRQLLDDPQQLRQLFALLVQAHYRTRPGDLRDLLDDPALQVWLLHAPPQPHSHSQPHSSRLLGVVLVAEEGGFEPELADQIWLGKRRPRGHLLPQVLAAQAGWRQAPRLRYWRIVRIAIPEQLRMQGLGTEMIRRLRCEAQLRQVDLLGSSFGATEDLLPFWYAQSMRPLRLGLKADASSGCVSLLYGCGCSDAGQRFLVSVAQRFALDLPRQLQGANADLESGLVRVLLQQSRDALVAQVDLQDMHDLYALVFGQRGWEQAEPALYRWVLQQLLGPERVFEPLLERVLIYRLVQRRGWAVILPLLQLTGVRQAEHWLRTRLKPLLADQMQAVTVDAE
ncbi:MAG: GNAT family N-acetyltransferase [Motiliproteus sp.]